METAVLQKLSLPGVTLLVAFLSLSSQWLFQHIEPGRIRKGDAYVFDLLVASLLVCYWRTCLVDPGRIPQRWHENPDYATVNGHVSQRQRWCRKCEAFKPPRAHHCKTCKRCIVKMDHHCVWTANCISHITFPHFIRFLFYAVAAMIYLEYFLYERCAVIWQKRHLPSYLGPSVFQLTHLFILTITNSAVLFMLLLLLGRTLWSMALNTTTIEGWEIERHETLLRRARVLGGYLIRPDGTKVRIEQQEFPWDIGIWKNICQAMGTGNPIAWFWPLARSPSVESGLSFEHNEIEDPRKPWPPPDPDRMLRAARPIVSSENGFTKSMDIEDFRKRQAADLTRYADMDGEYVVRRRPFHERLEEMNRATTGSRSYYNTADDVAVESEECESGSEEPLPNAAKGEGGEEAWRNKEGECLADFGVDEVADFYDEDDVPLAELMNRLRAPK